MPARALPPYLPSSFTLQLTLPRSCSLQLPSCRSSSDLAEFVPSIVTTPYPVPHPTAFTHVRSTHTCPAPPCSDCPFPTYLPPSPAFLPDVNRLPQRRFLPGHSPLLFHLQRRYRCCCVCRRCRLPQRATLPRIFYPPHYLPAQFLPVQFLPVLPSSRPTPRCPGPFPATCPTPQFFPPHPAPHLPHRPPAHLPRPPSSHVAYPTFGLLPHCFTFCRFVTTATPVALLYCPLLPAAFTRALHTAFAATHRHLQPPHFAPLPVCRARITRPVAPRCCCPALCTRARGGLLPCLACCSAAAPPPPHLRSAAPRSAFSVPRSAQPARGLPPRAFSRAFAFTPTRLCRLPRVVVAPLPTYRLPAAACRPGSPFGFCPALPRAFACLYRSSCPGAFVCAHAHTHFTTHHARHGSRTRFCGTHTRRAFAQVFVPPPLMPPRRPCSLLPCRCHHLPFHAFSLLLMVRVLLLMVLMRASPLMPAILPPACPAPHPTPCPAPPMAVAPAFPPRPWLLPCRPAAPPFTCCPTPTTTRARSSHPHLPHFAAAPCPPPTLHGSARSGGALYAPRARRRVGGARRAFAGGRFPRGARAFCLQSYRCLYSTFYFTFTGFALCTRAHFTFIIFAFGFTFTLGWFASTAHFWHGAHLQEGFETRRFGSARTF